VTVAHMRCKTRSKRGFALDVSRVCGTQLVAGCADLVGHQMSRHGRLNQRRPSVLVRHVWHINGTGMTKRAGRVAFPGALSSDG
jgi:hypothetical protein